MQGISIIIPALNEGATIAGVIALARRSSLPHEVIVVDDGSIDDTAAAARRAGARVIRSSLLGKGASMEDGVRAAAYPLILFLDGDLTGLEPDLVDRMARPLLAGTADFVKASFARHGGRVTVLTARPLLQAFFPEVAHLDQPLGGICAAPRELLSRLRFETDYAVDVGLLIDASLSGARVAEVPVGHLDHDGQELHALAEMAGQVARGILDRAARAGRLARAGILEAEERERRSRSELRRLRKRVAAAGRLALIDMDGTLLEGRFVEELARRHGRQHALGLLLDAPDLPAVLRARAIAQVFAGLRRRDFEAVARAMPLTTGAADLVIALRRAGYTVGIVSDSWLVATEIVRRRVFADFSVAHLLRFRERVATGELEPAPAMLRAGGCLDHPICKLNVLLHLCEAAGIGPEQVLAIGDGEGDACMVGAAGLGIAFQSKSPALTRAAGLDAQQDLRRILAHVSAA